MQGEEVGTLVVLFAVECIYNERLRSGNTCGKMIRSFLVEDMSVLVIQYNFLCDTSTAFWNINVFQSTDGGSKVSLALTCKRSKYF